MVVHEIPLRSVPMQVRLGNVEIAAIDGTLENRKVVLDRVGVPEVRADIFLRAVVDGAVPGELATDRPIDRAFVGHQVSWPC